MSVDTFSAGLADTPFSIPGAGTVNSVGIVPANVPLGALALEVNVSNVAVALLDCDIKVQTAVTSAVGGDAWKDCVSSRENFVNGAGVIRILVVDPILDRVRYSVVSRTGATADFAAVWLADRPLAAAE